MRRYVFISEIDVLLVSLIADYYSDKYKHFDMEKNSGAELGVTD